MLTQTKAKSIAAAGVVVETDDGEERTIPAVSVVVAVGFKTDDVLASSLEGAPYQVVTIGDAKQSRKAIDAVMEGFEAGRVA